MHKEDILQMFQVETSKPVVDGGVRDAVLGSVTGGVAVHSITAAAALLGHASQDTQAVLGGRQRQTCAVQTSSV